MEPFKLLLYIGIPSIFVLLIIVVWGVVVIHRSITKDKARLRAVEKNNPTLYKVITEDKEIEFQPPTLPGLSWLTDQQNKGK